MSDQFPSFMFNHMYFVLCDSVSQLIVFIKAAVTFVSMTLLIAAFTNLDCKKSWDELLLTVLSGRGHIFIGILRHRVRHGTRILSFSTCAHVRLII